MARSSTWALRVVLHDLAPVVQMSCKHCHSIAPPATSRQVQRSRLVDDTIEITTHAGGCSSSSRSCAPPSRSLWRSEVGGLLSPTLKVMLLTKAHSCVVHNTVSVDDMSGWPGPAVTAQPRVCQLIACPTRYRSCDQGCLRQSRGVARQSCSPDQRSFMHASKSHSNRMPTPQQRVFNDDRMQNTRSRGHKT